jgi:nuclear pore complex protein Nup155
MAQPMFSHDSQSSQHRRSDMFTSPTPSGSGARGQQLYPDLPTELRTPAPTYNAGAFMTPEHQRAAPPAPVPVPSQAVVPAKPSATDGLNPLGRAARAIAESLEAEKRYPQLDDIVSRRFPIKSFEKDLANLFLEGASHEYEMAQAYAWEPFQRINNYTIPDAIFEQYNRATSHTLMGLFAEIKQAWITVDNRLYMWDYQTQSGFQGFEGQSNTITSVRLLKPKRGVFQDVNYVLVIATTVELFLMGVNASMNARGTMDVTLYDTKMSVPTRGLDVTIIEGSNKTGRIFFGGKGDNDIYEFNYQVISESILYP